MMNLIVNRRSTLCDPEIYPRIQEFKNTSRDLSWFYDIFQQIVFAGDGIVLFFVYRLLLVACRAIPGPDRKTTENNGSYGEK